MKTYCEKIILFSFLFIASLHSDEEYTICLYYDINCPVSQTVTQNYSFSSNADFLPDEKFSSEAHSEIIPYSQESDSSIYFTYILKNYDSSSTDDLDEVSKEAIREHLIGREIDYVFDQYGLLNTVNKDYELEEILDFIEGDDRDDIFLENTLYPIFGYEGGWVDQELVVGEPVYIFQEEEDDDEMYSYSHLSYHVTSVTDEWVYIDISDKFFCMELLGDEVDISNFDPESYRGINEYLYFESKTSMKVNRKNAFECEFFEHTYFKDSDAIFSMKCEEVIHSSTVPIRQKGQL